MQHWLVTVSILAFLQMPSSGAGAADDAVVRHDVVTALRVAFDRQIVHAEGWLRRSDYKSLMQSAAGLELLGELLRAQGDDADWAQSTGRVIEAAKSVRIAAQGEDGPAARKAFQELIQAHASAKAVVPAGQAQPPPKASLGPLMLLMDGVRADAKIALIAGNVEGAKNGGYVLSELGRVVSNLRTGEDWSRLSEEFREASLAAARSSATDPAEVRLLLKAVSQRCDACHDSR